MTIGARSSALPDCLHQRRKRIERQVVRQVPAEHEVKGVVRQRTRQQRVCRAGERAARLGRVQPVDATEVREVCDLHAAPGPAEQSQHRGRRSAEIEDDVPFGLIQSGDEIVKKGSVKCHR